MSKINDVNLNLSYGWAYGEDLWKEGMDLNMVMLGGIACLSVKSISTTVQPSGANGDVYFVPVGATGSSWASNTNTIAVRVNDGQYDQWIHTPVQNGWSFTVQDDSNKLVTWGGSAFTDTVDTSAFLTESSSYTSTGDVDFNSSVRFTGSHTADVKELANIEDVNSAIASQDFTATVTKSGDNILTGNNTFTNPVSGVAATVINELATLGQVEAVRDNLTLSDLGSGEGVTGTNTQGDLSFKTIKSSDASVSITGSGTELDFTVTIPSSVSLFTDLTDTPADYTGQSGNLVTVNGTEDGLIFTTPFGETFLDLTDTPIDFTGADGYAVTVDETGGQLQFTQLDFSTVESWTDLNDTPNIIPNDGGSYFVKAKSDGTGIEFSVETIPTSSEDLSDMPVKVADKFLKVASDGQTYELVDSIGVSDFTDLGDVPSSYANSGGKVLKVLANETGITFEDESTGSILVEDSTTPVGNALTLNFGDNLSVTDEGNNKVTIDASGGGVDPTQPLTVDTDVLLGGTVVVPSIGFPTKSMISKPSTYGIASAVIDTTGTLGGVGVDFSTSGYLLDSSLVGNDQGVIHYSGVLDPAAGIESIAYSAVEKDSSGDWRLTNRLRIDTGSDNGSIGLTYSTSFGIQASIDADSVTLGSSAETITLGSDSSSTRKTNIYGLHSTVGTTIGVMKPSDSGRTYSVPNGGGGSLDLSTVSAGFTFTVTSEEVTPSFTFTVSNGNIVNKNGATTIVPNVQYGVVSCIKLISGDLLVVGDV